jgi:hypothetical protein
MSGCKKDEATTNTSATAPIAQPPATPATPSQESQAKAAEIAKKKATLTRLLEEKAAQSSSGQDKAKAASSSSGQKEEEGTVLKVRKLKGGRTIYSSSGIRRVEGPTHYEAQVGLADGTRFAFYPIRNKLQEGSKVVVRYTLKGGQISRPELPAAAPPEDGRIVADVLPMLKPTPVGDETYSITFPNAPSENKTDLGMLYQYEYKFSKSYRPDTYYFFRTNVEGKPTSAFFKEQAQSLLSLTGGKRVGVSLGGSRKDKKTGLMTVTGLFTIELSYFPQDGRIQLWYDAKKKVIYGAWVHAYSPNRLAEEPEMKSAFFGSFALK